MHHRRRFLMALGGMLIAPMELCELLRKAYTVKERAMKALLMLLALLFTLATAHADERWRSEERRGFPFGSERWEGTREWKPDRHFRRQWPWPDRFTVDRPGKCEVRCVRVGREYKCREYRC